MSFAEVDANKGLVSQFSFYFYWLNKKGRKTIELSGFWYICTVLGEGLWGVPTVWAYSCLLQALRAAAFQITSSLSFEDNSDHRSHPSLGFILGVKTHPGHFLPELWFPGKMVHHFLGAASGIPWLGAGDKRKHRSNNLDRFGENTF